MSHDPPAGSPDQLALGEGLLGQVRAPTAQLLVLSVRDILGNPIVGARVSCNAQFLAASGADGNCHVDRAVAIEGGVLIECAGYDSAAILPGQLIGVDGPFRVTLNWAGKIKGRVYSATGEPFSGTAFVTATPADRGRPETIEFLAADGDPTIVACATDSLGNFELFGLCATESYRIDVASACHVQRGRPPEPRPDDGFVTITLDEVFFAAIDVRSRDGKHVRPHGQALVGRYQAVASSTTTEILNLSSLQIQLGGLSMLGEEATRSVLARCTGSSPGQITFSEHIPGYEAYSVTVDLQACSSSPEATRVIVDPTCDGFGDLEVVADTTFSVEGEALGRLILTPSIGVVYTWMVIDDGGGVAHLTGIPQGDYAVTFEPRLQAASAFRKTVEPSHVSISSSPSRISLQSEPSQGSITVVPPAEHDRTRTIEAYLLTGHPDFGEGGSVELSGAPLRLTGPSYRVNSLRPGPYTVLCVAPAGLKRWHSTVTVEGGKTSDAVLVSAPGAN